MSPQSELLHVAETSLIHYFAERLREQAGRYDPPPNEDTCWYLSQLLERFVRSEALFTYDAGRLTLRPLAQLYGDAVEASSDRERCLLLQQLGDMALFMGALFPQRYARRGIRQDYFVGMGGAAYDYLAGNARRGRHIFEEMAGSFVLLLELVAQVCGRSADDDVAALHGRWLQRHDPAAARRLRLLGVDPDAPSPLH